jgi:hydroxyacylglutathione hydrolase
MTAYGPLEIQSFVDPMFQENCLIVRAAGANDCWIIDPGFAPQPSQALAAIRKRGLTPAAIVLTHCHVDHIAGINTVRDAYPDIPIWAPVNETDMLTDPMANFSGMYGVPISAPDATRTLSPGDTITLADQSFGVRDVAGHSPGGLAFCCAAAKLAIVGDALFAGGIGRYDFPGSSGERLLANIRAQLLTLPDDTVVFPGHGPTTTIGKERRTNPFLQPGFEP